MSYQPNSRTMFETFSQPGHYTDLFSPNYPEENDPLSQAESMSEGSDEYESEAEAQAPTVVLMAGPAGDHKTKSCVNSSQNDKLHKKCPPLRPIYQILNIQGKTPEIAYYTCETCFDKQFTFTSGYITAASFIMKQHFPYHK